MVKVPAGIREKPGGTVDAGLVMTRKNILEALPIFVRLAGCSAPEPTVVMTSVQLRVSRLVWYSR